MVSAPDRFDALIESSRVVRATLPPSVIANMDQALGALRDDLAEAGIDLSNEEQVRALIMGVRLGDEFPRDSVARTVVLAMIAEAL